MICSQKSFQLKFNKDGANIEISSPATSAKEQPWMTKMINSTPETWERVKMHPSIWLGLDETS